MSNEFRKFAASSNGDSWLLGRDSGSGVAYVLHQANQPSGGARTRIEVIDFLQRGRVAPEHHALLVLIGSLAGVEVSEESRDLAAAKTVGAADAGAV